MVRTTVVLIDVLGLLAFARPVAATHFLGRLPGVSESSELESGSELELLSEIEAALGNEHRLFMEKRLVGITESMRAAYRAIPKNDDGRLGHAAATYVLHRLFVQRHGWSVFGLDPHGQSLAAFNSSEATIVLKNGVPDHVLGLFEKRIGRHGLGLQELALMASTLEHLVHKEAIHRLHVAYESHNFSSEDVLSDTEADMIMDSYMAYYLLGRISGNISTITPTRILAFRQVVDGVYPTWKETQKFIRDVRERVAPNRDLLYFADVARVVEEVGNSYGRWQDSECRAVKDLLVQSEHAGSGRVRLADFYRKALLEGAYQFGENVRALQQMGALDDSDPTDLRVIIPNYVYSPTNCVAGSSYYSVCCIDECDGLLTSLERKFARPDLSVGEIATHFAAVPSSTVPGNRTMPTWLLRRLDEVAGYHGGRVPLHGRLFAQWLHHAYPRECRYPQVSGTTDPLQGVPTFDNYEETSATEEDMQDYIQASPRRRRPADNASTAGEAEEGGSMWTMEEELVVWHPSTSAQEAAALPVLLRSVAFIGALPSMLGAAVAYRRSLKLPDWDASAVQKRYV